MWNQKPLAASRNDRRLGSHYKLELEAPWFADIDSADPLTVFRDDNFVTLRFSRYF